MWLVCRFRGSGRQISAGVALCEPVQICGTALCELRSAEFVAGAALGEPRSADFVAGASRSAEFVAGAATSKCRFRGKRSTW